MIFQGACLRQVKISVIVLILCFFFRFAFDSVKSIFAEEFMQFRIDSLNGDSWNYPILFIFMILVMEIVPIVLFTINLDLILSKKVALSYRTSRTTEMYQFV